MREFILIIYKDCDLLNLAMIFLMGEKKVCLDYSWMTLTLISTRRKILYQRETNIYG